jgi:hypothetical protein
MFAFELLFLFGLPLLLACGAAYLTWRTLSRPLVFLTVAATILYFVYAASIWLLAPGPFGFIVSVPQPGAAPASEPLFLLLPPYKTSLIAFAAAAIPVLAVLLRVFKKGARK